MTRYAAFLLLPLLLLATIPARAAGDVEQVVARHLAAAARGDVDAIVRDYAENALVITPAGATKGRPAIRAMFRQIFGGPSMPPLTVDKEIFHGDVGYLLWHQAGPRGVVHGSDTFVLRHGRIVVQTVAMLPAGPPHR